MAKFRLSRDHAEQFSRLKDELKEKRALVDEALSHANKVLDKVLDEHLTPAIDEYNKVVETANDFCVDVADYLRAEFDGRSEAWQEGEKGEAANRLIEAWESTEISHAACPFQKLDVYASELDEFNELPEDPDDA